MDPVEENRQASRTLCLSMGNHHLLRHRPRQPLLPEELVIRGPGWSGYQMLLVAYWMNFRIKFDSYNKLGQQLEKLAGRIGLPKASKGAAPQHRIEVMPTCLRSRKALARSRRAHQHEVDLLLLYH